MKYFNEIENLNALHYFVTSMNLTGIKFCFDNNVPFLLDKYLKTPLDYAKYSKNIMIFNSILKFLRILDDKEIY